MGFTSFVGLGIGLLIIVMIILISQTDKGDMKNKPHLLSWLTLGLIILNWLIFLSEFYAVIPEGLVDLIFLPLWIILSIMGAMIAYREFTNNRVFSVVSGGLTIISFVMIMLIWGIGNM